MHSARESGVGAHRFFAAAWRHGYDKFLCPHVDTCRIGVGLSVDGMLRDCALLVGTARSGFTAGWFSFHGVSVFGWSLTQGQLPEERMRRSPERGHSAVSRDRPHCATNDPLAGAAAMLKNGVAIRRSRHHWFFGLRPATGGKIPTTHFFAQAQVTLLSTLQRGAGSGAKK